MSVVDPYTQPFPKTVQDSNGNITPEFRQWLVYDNRWKFDMWTRSGGGDDGLDEIRNGELYEPGIQTSNVDELVDELEVSSEMAFILDFSERIEDLESRNDAFPAFDERIEELEVELAQTSVFTTSDELEIVEIPAGGTALTTTGNQLIVCNNTAAATVTLNPNPSDGERVHIKRRDAGVTISGDVDGVTSLTIANIYDAPHLVYSSLADEWMLI
ncbi:MAG: hypothetical protein V3U84_11540 [Thiotrichaceae bacterium]